MSPQAASRVGVFLLAAVAAGVAPVRVATFTVNTTVDSYRATVECRDNFGNTSLGTVAVTVPPDRR